MQFISPLEDKGRIQENATYDFPLKIGYIVVGLSETDTECGHITSQLSSFAGIPVHQLQQLVLEVLIDLLDTLVGFIQTIVFILPRYYAVLQFHLPIALPQACSLHCYQLGGLIGQSLLQHLNLRVQMNITVL